MNPRCDVFLPGKPYRNTSGWADFQAPLATKSGDFGLLAKYVEEVKAREEARGKSSKLVGPVDEDDSVLAEGGSSVEKVEQVEKGKSVSQPFLEEEDGHQTNMQQNAILVSEPANKDASRKIDTEDWMIDLSWELGAQEAGDEGGFREEALAELQHKFAVVMDGTEMEKSEGLEAVVENSKYLLKAKAFGSGSKHEGSRVPQREDYYEPMIPSRWRDPRKAKKGVEKAHEHGFDDLLLCGEHVKVEIATHEVDVWATEIVSLLD